MNYLFCPREADNANMIFLGSKGHIQRWYDHTKTWCNSPSSDNSKNVFTLDNQQQEISAMHSWKSTVFTGLSET